MAHIVKNLHAMKAELGQIPGLGRSPGEGKDYPLQYSGLEYSMDCSPLGSSVHGILQARILEWVAMRMMLKLKLQYFGHLMRRVASLEKRSEERRVGKECRSRWSPYH